MKWTSVCAVSLLSLAGCTDAGTVISPDDELGPEEARSTPADTLRIGPGTGWDWDGIGIATGAPPPTVGCDAWTCGMPTQPIADLFEEARDHIKWSDGFCTTTANFFYNQVYSSGSNYNHVVNLGWTTGSHPTGGHITNHAYPHIIFGEYFLENSGAFDLAWTIMHEMYHHYNPTEVEPDPHPSAEAFAGFCTTTQ